MVMNRSALLAVAAGVFGATLLVAALRGSLLGVMFGTLLSPLPLAMAVLGLGPAFLPVAVVSGAVTTTVLTGSFAAAVIYLVVDALPVALLMRFGRGQGPHQPADGAAVGRAAAWLALAALGLIVAGLALMPLGEGGVEATVRARLGEVIAQAREAGQGRLGLPDRPEAIAALASFLPGAAGWNWCLRAIVSAALAQAVLMRMGGALYAAPAYRAAAVPGWFIAAFWAAAATSWLAPGDAGFVALNAAAVMCLPLLLQGLAVVHSGIARFDRAGLWLVAFYVMALLMAALAFVVLVCLGVVDHFLKLRARMVPPPRGG
ncbi:MAG: DUF2232 domain-containing protein [Rhodospirillaceae bacterium]|nr:DUF2232 domain-containing protein [Rhodospirillaceae bacterium]